MLAQSFQSAADLGITEPQRDALQKVLVLLETDKLKHVPDLADDDYADGRPHFTGHFHMARWGVRSASCGTAACIGGTAELIAGANLFGRGQIKSSRLKDLFFPYCFGEDDTWASITTAQAARALRSYLTCGEAKWLEAIA